MPDARAGLGCLPCLLFAGLGLQAGACAKATVGDVRTHDAAVESATAPADGKDGSPNDKNGKNDGPAADAPYGPCDPFTNSGCNGGEKCTALQSGSSLTLGCGNKGSGSEGDSCTPVSTGGSQTGDDCGDGLACFALTGEAMATCRRICPTSGTANACPAGAVCNLIVPGLTGLAFCRAATTCLPLEQTGCPSDYACYFDSTGAHCALKGATQPGNSCIYANDCMPGSTCLIVGTGTCSSFCSISGGSPACSGPSTGGNTCAALAGSPAGANFGSCR